MANKTKFSPPTSVDKSYREDPLDANLTRKAVMDEITHDKLQDLINAIGGTSPTTTTLINLTVPTANTEVSQVLPTNTKSFSIYNRDKSKIQLAFTSGESNTNYITIPPGKTYYNNNFYTNLTIYLRCYKGAQTIEIEAHV
jgi:hypothetical protein